MVLPCTLFPHSLMPLYIFEPRYRAMLTRALETDRMFCIGTCAPDDEDVPSESVSTAGLVRACVTHGDGTSHLLLLGLKRIRLTGWKQTEPFRIAAVEPIECETDDNSIAVHLANAAIDLSSGLAGPGQAMSEKVHDHLQALDDPSAVADVIAHSFITDPRMRQRLLETTDVVERLHCLGQFLQARITDQS